MASTHCFLLHNLHVFALLCFLWGLDREDNAHQGAILMALLAPARLVFSFCGQMQPLRNGLADHYLRCTGSKQLPAAQRIAHN